MPINEAEWHDCVEALYAAVGHEDALATALGGFRKFVDASGVAFLILSTDKGVPSIHVAACDISSSALVEYHSHYFQHDVWAQQGMARRMDRLGVVFRGSGIIPLPVLERSYFFMDFLKRYDVGDVLVSIADEGENGAPPVIVTFHRSVALGPYEDQHVAVARRLAPHVHRVLKLHRRFAPQIGLGTTLLELFREADAPMVLLDAKCAVVDRNEAAGAMLQQAEAPVRLRGRQLQLRDERGYWVAPRMDAPPNDHGAKADLIACHTSGAPALCLKIRAVHGSTTTLAKFPVSFICTARPFAATPVDRLRRKYSLTLAEAEVALALKQGLRVADIATRFGVAISTVRTQLSSVFTKTGATRQAQLVALLHQLED